MKSIIFLLRFFIFLAFVQSIVSWEDTSELTVRIKDGQILGRYMTSENGRPIKAFLGIPYAEPPIRELRFKAPQRVQPWSGIKNTQYDGAKCSQISSPYTPGRQIEGDENCLFLNVYAPRKAVPGTLPVIFWIYGGGFTFGEGSSATYGPEYLLDNNIILVTGNYRLGPLGFLSTEDRTAPGNAGFKDQNLILEWIQENIEIFGGNKNSVTIWGESAGSMSVNYHMISPMSQPLFHKAISHSGTINGRFLSVSGEGWTYTKNLASFFDCPTTDPNSAVSCLRNIPASELMQNATDAGFSVRAVIEDFPSDEVPFISTRNFSEPSVNIPWIVGINSEEGIATSYGYFSNPTAMSQLRSIWDTYMPSYFGYSHHNQTTKDEITRSINRFYFGNEILPVTLDSEKLTQLFSDNFLLMVESLRDRFEHQNNQRNTFVYLYSHKGTASFGPNAETFQGTCHADDLIITFPFQKSLIFLSSIPTVEDRELYKALPSIYANFAKNGSPNIFGVPTWPAATSIPFDYMTIGNENGKSNIIFKIKNGLYVDRANFWMTLREVYQLNRWKWY